MSKMRKGKDINCKWCGKIFYVFPSRIKVTKFCSYTCMRKYWKKHKIGVYNLSVQSKGGKASIIINRKNKTNCYFNLKLHSEIGKISGVIGGKRCHELYPNLSSENGKKVHKKYPNLASEMGKKNIWKSLETQRKKKLGFWNSKTQSNLGKIGGVNVQKTLRENVRNLKFKSQYYDSRPEIEISLCLQEQYNYVPKEGETLHIRIGNMECDYLLEKLFIEFHCFWKKGDIESLYYKKRRKILNENGYKDYPLIIIK